MKDYGYDATTKVTNFVGSVFTSDRVDDHPKPEPIIAIDNVGATLTVASTEN